ncbi:MAG TPA: hypothetical protein VJ743_23575 [Albitalea sp.]|nr:hypothetical protein [Albitalea sp.]
MPRVALRLILPGRMSAKVLSQSQIWRAAARDSSITDEGMRR